MDLGCVDDEALSLDPNDYEGYTYVCYGDGRTHFCDNSTRNRKEGRGHQATLNQKHLHDHQKREQRQEKLRCLSLSITLPDA